MSKFKVGDRVRYLGGSNAARVGAEAIVESVGEEFINLRWIRNGLDNQQMDGGYYPSRFAAVAPATALTLHTGKFYSTRDGRKVGPMEIDEAREWPAYVDQAPQYNHEWRLDGTWNCFVGIDSMNDLIAEWVDEPAVVEPKFKVGDRVRYKDEYVDGVGTIHSATERERDGAWYVTVEDKDLSWAYFIDKTARAFDENDLSVFAVTPATIKVGDWVRTDTDDRIGIVLTDDGSETWPYLVGTVGATDGDEAWEWFGAHNLTVVPPGTTQAATEPTAANDNYEVGDIVEIADDEYFTGGVAVGDIAAVIKPKDDDGDYYIRVQSANGPHDQFARPIDIRPYKKLA